MTTLTTLLAASLLVTSAAASATEYGTVVSSSPVTAQISVPQRSCQDRVQPVAPAPSGGGALLGAIVGGVLGNSVGGGMGRAAATGLGVVAGAAIGDQVESANNPPQGALVRDCRVSYGWQQQTVGYDVVYDYHGQRYNTRMTQAPGAQIALNVSVSPAESYGVAAVPNAPTALPAPVYSPNPYVVDAPADSPAYGPSYSFAPPVLSIVPQVVISAGWGGGWGRGGRRGYWH